MDSHITIVIPTSPIPSHPNTSLIEGTIKSLRYHLPHSPILIQCDGVRPEQEYFRQAYDEYKRRLSAHYAMDGLVSIVVFDSFQHQAAMLKKCLAKDLIKTPLILYIEHDLPLLPEPIEWEGMAEVILSGQVNKIRLHYWSTILPEHQYLMLDKEPVRICGVPLIRTIQWSQHPHLISTEFYKKVLSVYSEECRTMIETPIYGRVANAPWEEYRCAIYSPIPGPIKRVVHVNGREEGPKFENTFTF